MERYTERDWQRLVGWGMCPKSQLIESSSDGADTESIDARGLLENRQGESRYFSGNTDKEAKL